MPIIAGTANYQDAPIGHVEGVSAAVSAVVGVAPGTLPAAVSEIVHVVPQFTVLARLLAKVGHLQH